MTETHLALITKFSVLAMEHEQLKKSSSKTISEYKAIIEMLSGRLEKLEARQDSVAMQLNCASENIQNLNAKIKGFEPEKVSLGDKTQQFLKFQAVGTSESASENFPAAPTTSATSQPMVHPQIVEINKRLKAARTSQEREAVFADMKKNPILFHAWMRQPKD